MENTLYQKLTHKNLAKNTHLRREELINSLKEEAHFNRLTGLPNENAFMNMLDGLQNSWARKDLVEGVDGGTFIEFDATGLKIVNDKFGRYEGGNKYLICIADSIKKSIRAEDRVFRLGDSSDEFILHLAETTDKKNIDKVLDRIDQELKNHQEMLQEKYPGIKFSLSSSISTYGTNRSPENAFEIADFNMTEAKKSSVDGARAGNVGRIYSD